MTLGEKVGQMTMKSGAAYIEAARNGLLGSVLNAATTEMRNLQEAAMQSRLQVPLLSALDIVHGYQTMFPIPLAESASWDIEAIEKSAHLAAKEATANGYDWTFAPMVDIARDARWGRVMEGAGEDVFLGSTIAAARVKGFQGEDLSRADSLIACAKHVAAYGYGEGGRDYEHAELSDQTLNEVVMPPFKSASDAGVATMMSGFNDVNGIPVSGNKQILRHTLKHSYGFEGFIVSDYSSIEELENFRFAATPADSARIATTAGVDMEMVSDRYSSNLETLVSTNSVSIQYIDDAVRRILSIKFAAGLFDDPYRNFNATRSSEVTGSSEMTNHALDIAQKSIVLLKNEDSILPLSHYSTLALIGPLAADKNVPLGNWRANAVADSAVSVKEAFEHANLSMTYSKGIDLIAPGFNQGFLDPFVYLDSFDTDMMNDAVQKANGSEVVVLVVGESAFGSGESRSVSDLELPGTQQQLLENLHEVNQNIIMVLMTGRPLVLTKAEPFCKAIVLTWHLGSESGNAISSVLLGDHNPGGKLPMTFPRSTGQVPIYYARPRVGRPGSASGGMFTVGYSDTPSAPLYPFGYGLSYTTFVLSNKILNNQSLTDSYVQLEDGELKLNVTIANTGSVRGTEVVQVYIEDRFASSIRPVKQLQAFEKVSLDAGEQKHIHFEIASNALKVYNTESKTWAFEPGDFKVSIQTASEERYFKPPHEINPDQAVGCEASQVLTVHTKDSWGDSWNAGSMTLTFGTSSLKLLGPDTEEKTYRFCTTSCFTLTFDVSGEYPSEVSADVQFGSVAVGTVAENKLVLTNC
jgi:beta-glucosidase